MQHILNYIDKRISQLKDCPDQRRELEAVRERLQAVQPAQASAEVMEALDPFVRALKINDTLNPNDDDSLRDWLPGVWPTVGDLRKLVAALSAAPAPVPALPKVPDASWCETCECRDEPQGCYWHSPDQCGGRYRRKT